MIVGQKTFLIVIICLLATPSFACDCHGSGFSGGFGSFANWQLPTQGCIPSHISLDKGEITYQEQEPEIAENSEAESVQESIEEDTFPAS